MTEGPAARPGWLERWLGELAGRLRELPAQERAEVARRAAGEDQRALDELTTLLEELGSEAALPREPDSLLPSGGALAGAVWDRLAEELADVEPKRAEIAPGARIGRYVVLHELGVGGMGSVYAAYDPELDRQVAVKVLREDLFGANDPSHDWLRQEAQALARLAHPNVVTVHDVGSSEGRLFLAMERVEGVDLRDWLGERSRSRREILAMFRAIGQGLAAAHGAGLVHRDFKPQNVIVGKGGRPRILDFGLARAADSPPEPTAGDVADSAGASRTIAARVVGTPAYMAPEQFDGAVDARSDQYAFCLALWEALHGQRPFADESITRVVERRKAGQLPPRARADVPKRLRRVLVRGLAAEPSQRFASMDDLLAALDRATARPRWVAVAIGAIAVVGVATWAGREATPPCRVPGAALAETWGDARQEEVAAAFSASGYPQAVAALERVSVALDRWSEAWLSMRVDACRATHVRGEQSEELLDLRYACLDRRREEARAFVDLLATADEATVAEAPKAAQGLAPLAVCADPRLLTAPAPPPEDPAHRERLTKLEERLAEAKALRDLGRPAEATETARELATAVTRVSEASAVAFESAPSGIEESTMARWATPLAAEIHYLLADLEDLQGDFDAAEADLFRSWSYALRGGHDEYVGRTLTLLIWLDGNDRGDLARGRHWARVASATLDRMDAGPLLRADYHSNLGSALQTAGYAREAMQEHELALGLRILLFGEESYEAAKSLNNLGSAHFAAAEFERAGRYYQRALDIVERSLGVHPATAMAWSNVGSALIEIGRPHPARSAHERALEIRRTIFGEESFWVAVSVVNLGFVELKEEPERSLAHFRRAREGFEAALPADHPYQAYPLSGLGRAYLELGQPGEARPLLERAVALWEDSGAALPHDLATDRFALARALVAVGVQRDRALALARAALEGLAELDAQPLPLRDRIRAWLAERGSPA